MQRKRYETNLDEIQAQAVQRAKAGMHPAVAQARERMGTEQPTPVERQTGGVEAPAQSQRPATPPGVLQRLVAQMNTGQTLMRHRPQASSEGPPNVRQRVLEQMKRRYGGRVA